MDDLIARLEKLATTRERLAAERLSGAVESDSIGNAKLAEIERALANEHQVFAADLRAAAQAVRQLSDLRAALVEVRAALERAR